MAFVYEFLCEHMLSFLLGVYLEVEFLSYVLNLCLNFWGTVRLLPEGMHHYTFPQQRTRVAISPHPWQHLWLSVFLITAVLLGVKWYLTLVLICITMMADNFLKIWTHLLGEKSLSYALWFNSFPVCYNLLNYFKNSVPGAALWCIEK